MPTLSEVVRIPRALPNGDSFLTNYTSIVEGVLTFFITVTITQTRKMERITPATARIAENIGMIDNCPLFGSVVENDSSIDYRHFSTYEPVDSFGISDHQHGSIDCVAIRNGRHVGGSDHSRLSSRRQGGSVHGRNNWNCLFLSSARCHRNCKQA